MEVLENFRQGIASGFVIVDFYAPWCGDCMRIEPVMRELGEKYTIHKVNIDDSESVASAFNIRRIPTIIFFKDGKEVGNRLVEPRGKQEILDEIAKIS